MFASPTFFSATDDGFTIRLGAVMYYFCPDLDACGRQGESYRVTVAERVNSNYSLSRFGLAVRR